MTGRHSFFLSLSFTLSFVVLFLSFCNCLQLCMFACLSVCLSSFSLLYVRFCYLRRCLSVWMAVFPSLCVSLSVCLSPSVSVWTKDCRSVCLSISLTYIYISISYTGSGCCDRRLQCHRHRETVSYLSVSLLCIPFSHAVFSLSLSLCLYAHFSFSVCLSVWLARPSVSVLSLSVCFFLSSVCLSISPNSISIC